MTMIVAVAQDCWLCWWTQARIKSANALQNSILFVGLCNIARGPRYRRTSPFHWDLHHTFLKHLKERNWSLSGNDSCLPYFQALTARFWLFDYTKNRPFQMVFWLWWKTTWPRRNAYWVTTTHAVLFAAWSWRVMTSPRRMCSISQMCCSSSKFNLYLADAWTISWPCQTFW